MNNKEYEYSFEVKDLTPFIQYCKDNDYQFVEKHEQERTIYRDKDRTMMARLTLNIKNGVTTRQLDFKEDQLVEGQILGERRESLALDYDNNDAVLSILDFLGFSQDNTLVRTRYVYQKGNVKFELDEYTVPRTTCVVGIEGEKSAVDTVYSEVKNFAKL